MRERKTLIAIRITEAQKEIIARLMERLQMTKTEVVGLALYKLALDTFRNKKS